MSNPKHPRKRHSAYQRVRRLAETITRFFKEEPGPESPDDPYALVGAPKKPRPPVRSATATEPPE